MFGRHPGRFSWLQSSDLQKYWMYANELVKILWSTFYTELHFKSQFHEKSFCKRKRWFSNEELRNITSRFVI